MHSEKLPMASLLPGQVPDDELVWQWFQSIAPFYRSVPLVKPGRGAIRPSHCQYHLGQFLFLDTSFSAQKFLRGPDWRRRNDDVDHLTLQVFVKGRNTVRNGNMEFVQDAGAVTVVNLGYDVEAQSSDADVLTVILPRDWLAEHLPDLRDARGNLFGNNRAAACLFTDFVLSLRRNLPDMTMADLPTLSRAMLGLLDGLLACDANASAAGDGVFMAVTRYIDENLDDLDLGVAKLCARFRLSRPTLFRLFTQEGGVQNYIQRRRLMACFKAISSPQHLHRKIYDIALDSGLANPSHLTVLFRKHFGMTPSDVREAARAHAALNIKMNFPAGGHTLSDVEVMQSWARSLTTPQFLP